MKRSTFTRTTTTALLVAAVAAPAAPASEGNDGGIVLRRDGSKAVQAPANLNPSETAPPAAERFDWGDAGIGAAAAVATLLLTSAGMRLVRRPRHPAPRAPLPVAQGRE